MLAYISRRSGRRNGAKSGAVCKVVKKKKSKWSYSMSEQKNRWICHEMRTAVSSDCGLRLRCACGVCAAGGDEGDNGRSTEFRGVISSSGGISGLAGRLSPVEAHGESTSLPLFPCISGGAEFRTSDVELTVGVLSPLSPFRCDPRLSSITARTLRNFDSDLR